MKTLRLNEKPHGFVKKVSGCYHLHDGTSPAQFMTHRIKRIKNEVVLSFGKIHSNSDES